jgi:Lipase (class 3)
MDQMLPFLAVSLTAPFGLLAKYLALLLLVLIFIGWLRILLSPAYKQGPDQVVERAPGRRSLGAPEPALPFATEDLDFALLSQAAYDQTPAGIRERKPASGTAENKLAERGWTKWHEFGEKVQLPQKLNNAHLRAQVWIQKSSNTVAVCFGGTVVSNGKDWISNFRWFIPFHRDEYTETVNVFGPAFAEEFVMKIRPQMSDQKPLNFCSTGHSLGGGLAQQLAYSLPKSSSLPRIQKVYAFDPSPVTGYFSVARALRRENRMGLLIDRIYERGEILAYLRSITNFIHQPSAINAAIRQIRYNLFAAVNPISGHSIPELAEAMWQLVQTASPAAAAAKPWRRPKIRFWQTSQA